MRLKIQWLGTFDSDCLWCLQNLNTVIETFSFSFFYFFNLSIGLVNFALPRMPNDLLFLTLYCTFYIKTGSNILICFQKARRPTEKNFTSQYPSCQRAGAAFPVQLFSHAEYRPSEHVSSRCCCAAYRSVGEADSWNGAALTAEYAYVLSGSRGGAKCGLSVTRFHIEKTTIKKNRSILR